MSTLLFTRCPEEMPAAINEANELLQYRRLCRHAAQESPVLGIVVRDALHTGVPAWARFDFEQGTGAMSNDGSPDSRIPESGEAAVGLRNAFISRSAWALCAFDGPGLRNAPNAEVRRDRLAAMLKNAFGDSHWSFLPLHALHKDTGAPQANEIPVPEPFFYDHQQGIIDDRSPFASSPMRISA